MPWDFRLLSQDHKAELVATWMIEKEIENYKNSEIMKRRERDKRDSPGKSPGKKERPVRPF